MITIEIENAKRFEVNLEDLAERLQANIDDVFQRTALGLFRRVIYRTPVDTGRLRANWQIGINSVTLSVVPWTGSPGGAAKEVATNKSLGSGAPSIMRATSYDIINITNNVNYVLYVENGTPRQAPRKMARMSVLETIQELKQISGLLR